MNITAMQMYWLVMLDNIIGFFIAILLLCAAFFVFGFPLLGALDKEDLFFPTRRKAR